MNFRPLPIEKELDALTQTGGADAAMRQCAGYFRELIQHKGFQLVIRILRELDRSSLAALRNGDSRNPERLLGHLECIETIRRNLTALLPVSEDAGVAWDDEEEEAFLNIDRATTDNE